jgi:excisionase family DNA binding protein
MSAEDLLSIEEAAQRLGVSVATARRMAAAGKISATKSGKQWIVDGSLLRSQPARRRAAAKPVIDLEQALRYVEGTDLTEVWVPDVLRYADLLEQREAIIAEARTRFENLTPGVAVEVEVDKTLIFTRWATLLDLEDRVAYQAAVGSFAHRAEAETPDSVFSARLADGPRYFFKHGSKQWLAWRRHVLAQLTDGYVWMVKTDLTSYFDTIPHEPLIAEIRSLNAEPAVVNAIMAMLRTWQPVSGAGLPQGPNASRLLGNLHLVPVDRAMLAAGWRYSRYLDDIRIVTATRSEAIRAVRQLQRECRSRGLVVSSSKTDLLYGDEARQSLLGESDLAAAEYFMNMNVSGIARKHLKAILRKALKSDVRIDERRVRFSLWRLAQLRESGTLGLVLNRLEDLAPNSSIVASYLRPFISRPRVTASLQAFLANDERCHSRRLATWLFAAMLERSGTLPTGWADEAGRRVRNRNEPAFLRAMAAIVFARGGRAADVAWIKSDMLREHDPTVLRGYAVALHWVHALDRATQRQLAARAPRLRWTTEYLQGRQNLPSLVYRDARLRID